MRILLYPLLFISTFVSASPVEWDFEELPVCSEIMCFEIVPNKTYSYLGFEMEQFYKPDPTAVLNYTYSMRGTSNAFYQGPALSLSTNYYYEIRKSDNTAFSIDSLTMFGGISQNIEPINLIFNAEYADGSVNTTYATKNAFWADIEQYSDDSWSNIVSLTIENDGFYSIYQNIGFALDNVVFNASGEIPNPATLSLIVAGFLASRLRAKAKKIS